MSEFFTKTYDARGSSKYRVSVLGLDFYELILLLGDAAAAIKLQNNCCPRRESGGGANIRNDAHKTLQGCLPPPPRQCNRWQRGGQCVRHREPSRTELNEIEIEIGRGHFTSEPKKKK